MTAFQIVFKAASLNTLWLGVASVLAGTAAAAAHGNVEFAPAMMCLLFAVFAQATSNVIHRYYDEKHHSGDNEADHMVCDDVDRPMTFILGEGIKIFGVLAAMAGLAILAMAGWWTLIIALILGIVALINNVGRSPFSRTPFYPIATFLVFGPIGVLGTELVQSQRNTAHLICWWDLGPAVMMSLIIGLMAMNSHIFYGIFHRRTQITRSRTTFYYRYGRKGAMTLLTVSTLLYGALGIWAPYEMTLYPAWVYLPVPIISVIFNLFIIFTQLKPGSWRRAWRLSLMNIMFVALASLIIFLTIGYEGTGHDIISPF